MFIAGWGSSSGWSDPRWAHWRFWVELFWRITIHVRVVAAFLGFGVSCRTMSPHPVSWAVRMKRTLL